MSLGIGIVGAGVMGGDHARTLSRSVHGARLVALADADRERAAAVAAEAGGPRLHAEGRALVEDPQVEAVLVASPDATHQELVLACLAAGKPVLCEKPLAPTAAACLDIVAAEVKLGRRLIQVGFMRRFDPGYVAMRAALAEGRIGAPVMMHCLHHNAGVPPWFDAGIVVTNSAVHEIDVARWLLDDEFVAVSAFLRGTDGGAPGDRQFLVLETRRGVLVDVALFLNARYGYDVRAELVGETGTVALRPQAPAELRQAGLQAIGLAPDWRAHFAAAYVNQLQAWVDAIRRGTPTGASAWDGYVASATADAGLEALRTGGRTAIALQPRPAFYGG
ncbi:Gfo/Idh/MocA family protein [Labrys wisconsinensis]|uniref:Inositol 2-dehydrogenase n=1 Tax=Labrys wisconsinensis TaxID=425677 RepID=A0ABU0JD52_9HYPH|nr:Gfo/Idh/MocA family oxidoreductase [Labrys wisconsinensis]MDQ0471328.1 myo-inositol 2-dehydrogenase/D-chiro-inositol 1-dehydrogenase [Labrys wisconsinensis]